MADHLILLCGGTGELGGAIARRLHDRGIRFRALVRPATDAMGLDALDADIVRGDFRDVDSLRSAVQGVDTIISTVNAIGRLLGGLHPGSIRDVDERGYADLISEAEQAVVQRFVYVSILGDFHHYPTPFTDAKAATEKRLRASSIHEVIVRPDAFQEVWLGPQGGFDLARGHVTIYGNGRVRHRYVAIDDVAEAVVRLATSADAPRIVDLAGPEPMSAMDAVSGLERRIGHSLRTRRVPRAVMRAGRVLTMPVKPEVASVMGMALDSDSVDTAIGDEGFRRLGIDPRSASVYLDSVTVTSPR